MNVLASRTQALEALFDDIARTRMAGVPVLNRALQVEAVGFMRVVGDDGEGEAVGVLVTPWFMNLVWLPLQRIDRPHRVGHARERAVGETPFVFLSAHEGSLGTFEACSLVSPMFEFTDHAQARATAVAVLAELRAEPATPQAPARRSFLFGRSAAGARAA